MILETILILIALCLVFYRYVTKNFDRWKDIGVPFTKGRFPYGSHVELISQSRHINELIREDYDKFINEDLHGSFFFGKPILTIHNMEMIKHVLVKDFNSFVDRNDTNLIKLFDGGEYDQVWVKQLPSLLGDEWKDVRATFSPIFTSGKMKGMVKFIRKVGESLNMEFGKFAESGEDFELKEVFGKFSLDALATCAFGINPQSFEDKSTIFVKHAARIFTMTTLDNLKMFSRLIPFCAELQKFLNLNAHKPKATKFFRDVIRQTIQHRRETGERPNDLIDLMIDCMKTSKDSEENNTDVVDQYENDMKLNHNKNKLEFDEDIIVSTALILLVAGYDTTGMTLSFMGYYLSMHPDLQSRLQGEIDQAFEENGGKLPEYQAIQELPYLEMCIMESLRLLTPVGGLIRVCTKDYKFPNTHVEVKKNDVVVIPASGIHRDEKYYPNPNQFNPENFSKEAKQSRSPYAFLGFGQGPRACIGMRFALLEAKVAMMMVLSNYTFVYSQKNPDKHVIDPHSQLGYVKGGLFSKIRKRN